jgi:hypothetical protein
LPDDEAGDEHADDRIELDRPEPQTAECVAEPECDEQRNVGVSTQRVGDPAHVWVSLGVY